MDISEEDFLEYFSEIRPYNYNIVSHNVCYVKIFNGKLYFMWTTMSIHRITEYFENNIKNGVAQNEKLTKKVHYKSFIEYADKNQIIRDGFNNWLTKKRLLKILT